MLKIIILLIGLVSQVAAISACWASDTSLLFVGEDVSVLTIASRRAETPDKAPAIARVISSEEIEKRGFRTLGEVLADLPGFHISSGSSGTVSSLRGLPDGVLFLYDSVPFTSDAAKSILPLDQELSLANVQRIEIIRGPGSVLWGPDAFAGIVNIVPKRGRDVNGVELAAFGGSTPSEVGGALSWGKNAGLWEAFLSLSATSPNSSDPDYNVGALLGPNGKPLPLTERMTSGTIQDSKYTEAVLNFSWQDWLHLSGRWSDTRKEYVLEDKDAELRWPVHLEEPFWYVRLELEKKFAESALRLNGYYNAMDEQKQELDLPLQNLSSRVSYGELVYDRELWQGDGMLTLGASYRHNQIQGAEITKAYLPDFFELSTFSFFPSPQQSNFSTDMSALFGQLKRHWDHIDAWCGFRFTDHSEYQVKAVPNVGLSWSPVLNWNLKMLYGSSYRTPFARQLVNRSDLEMEEIDNTSASLTWRATPTLRLVATAFRDQVNNHTTQDPYYGGLSDPSTQKIYGLEFEAGWQVTPTLRLQGNATAFTHEGEDETYTYYAYTLEDGVWQRKPWASWSIPYETGPNTMVNAGLLWSPADKLNLSLNAKYETSWDYAFAKGEELESVAAGLQVNAGLTISDIAASAIDLQVTIKNLTNNSAMIKGTYGSMEPLPLGVYLELRWKF